MTPDLEAAKTLATRLSATFSLPLSALATTSETRGSALQSEARAFVCHALRTDLRLTFETIAEVVGISTQAAKEAVGRERARREQLKERSRPVAKGAP